MAQARKASKVNKKINMFVYGEPFTGKTTLGIQLAKLHDENGQPMRVLVLDSEAGGCEFAIEELENEGINLENIYVVYTQSLEEVTHYIKLVTDNKDIYELDEEGNETDQIVLDADGKPFRAGALLVDGTSVLKMACQQSLLNLSRKRARVRATKQGVTGEEKAVAIDGAGLEYKDYNTLNFSGQQLILNLAASGVHWIATAREKKETKSVHVNGSIQSVETGKLIADGFKGAEYNSDTLIRLYRDEDDPDTVKAYVIKDRSKTWAVGQIVENPSLVDFQKMIDKRTGNDVVIKNSMDQAVEIEMQMYQKQAGIIDDDTPTTEAPTSSNAPSPADIKAQIKALSSKLYPETKKEVGNRLKAEGLPTSYAKTDDIQTLTRMLEIVKEVSEG